MAIHVSKNRLGGVTYILTGKHKRLGKELKLKSDKKTIVLMRQEDIMARVIIEDEDGARSYDCKAFIFSAIVTGDGEDATWETDVVDNDQFDALLYYLEDEYYSE